MHENLKVLVTGGTGFLGSVLCRMMQNKSYNLTLLSRHPHKNLNSINYIQGDLESKGDCNYAVAGADIVVHIAGEKKDQSKFKSVNVKGTMNIFNASIANNISRFIHISSTGVIGASPFDANDYNENSACFPNNNYEISKLYAEKIVLRNKSSNIDTTVLRPSNIFGENDPNQTLLTLSKAVKNRRFAFIGGRQSNINMVYVKDVAAAIIALIEHSGKIDGRIFHISDTSTIGQFIDGLTDELGHKRIKLSFPDYMGKLFRSTLRIAKQAKPQIDNISIYGRIASLCNKSRFNTDELEKHLNFKMPYGWRYGLKQLVAWYRAQGCL
ncbi:NAD-dependent epimerase/dehydratase family protein [Thermodesulfobacteriota bacterium]